MSSIVFAIFKKPDLTLFLNNREEWIGLIPKSLPKWIGGLHSALIFILLDVQAGVSSLTERAPSPAPLVEVNVSASERPSSGSGVSSFYLHSASPRSGSLLCRAKRLFLSFSNFSVKQVSCPSDLWQSLTYKAAFPPPWRPLDLSSRAFLQNPCFPLRKMV